MHNYIQHVLLINRKVILQQYNEPLHYLILFLEIGETTCGLYLLKPQEVSYQVTWQNHAVDLQSGHFNSTDHLQEKSENIH